MAGPPKPKPIKEVTKEDRRLYFRCGHCGGPLAGVNDIPSRQTLPTAVEVVSKFPMCPHCGFRLSGRVGRVRWSIPWGSRPPNKNPTAVGMEGQKESRLVEARLEGSPFPESILLDEESLVFEEGRIPHNPSSPPAIQLSLPLRLEEKRKTRHPRISYAPNPRLGEPVSTVRRIIMDAGVELGLPTAVVNTAMMIASKALLGPARVSTQSLSPASIALASLVKAVEVHAIPVFASEVYQAVEAVSGGRLGVEVGEKLQAFKGSKTSTYISRVTLRLAQILQSSDPQTYKALVQKIVDGRGERLQRLTHRIVQIAPGPSLECRRTAHEILSELDYHTLVSTPQAVKVKSDHLAASLAYIALTLAGCPPVAPTMSKLVGLSQRLSPRYVDMALSLMDIEVEIV